VAKVVVMPTAEDDLAELIRTHSLPPDTKDRVKQALRPLARFPLLGAKLEGRWNGFRFVLGPWRWLLILYVFDEEADTVSIVTIQDGRSSRFAS
jgi:hypothetical protein